MHLSISNQINLFLCKGLGVSESLMLFRLVQPQCDDPVFWRSLIWELKVHGSECNMACSFVCLCVCVHMCTHILLVSWADVSLLKIDVQEENKKACYFSTHLWDCEKLEAHLILLVKVFLIRARFFSPFVPAEERHPSSELKRQLFWPTPATKEHSTKPYSYLCRTFDLFIYLFIGKQCRLWAPHLTQAVIV